MKHIQLYILLFISTFALAQETHHMHKHHVDIFLGATLETDTANKGDGKENKSSAFGLEYQYRINSQWGIGAAIEAIGDDTIREEVYVIPITYHINHSWAIFAGPGYEQAAHHGDYLLRAGVAYEYSLGNNFDIEPKFMADWIGASRTTWVAGVALGYGF